MTCKVLSFLSKKGFIGPIGDDLPSLIPIVVALVLFFSIFTMTLNTYNSKNASIAKQADMTAVSRMIKGDSLIVDMNQFQQRCANVRIKTYPYSVMVGIYQLDSVLDISTVVNDFVNSPISAGPSGISENFMTAPFKSDPSVPYFCSYKKVAAPDFSSLQKNYLLRFYPIAVQIQQSGGTYLIVPAMMAMVIW